ncbi:hypothetical protein GJAV_G00000310 [Gymnothorax javanicus]|nr:hypothetical protein GJAV_G00000310 [Gymnothorax javanicus]
MQDREGSGNAGLVINISNETRGLRCGFRKEQPTAARRLYYIASRQSNVIVLQSSERPFGSRRCGLLAKQVLLVYILKPTQILCYLW